MPLIMSTDSDYRDAEDSTRGSSESHFATKMYIYGRELCFVLAIVFTSYAALQNSPPKISKAPAPGPFFQQSSLVEDFYQGQLSEAFRHISESDVSFVMYYAPWDAESLEVRWQFEAVAKYYHEEIYFAAINCWYPEGECRHHFTKIPSFPILIVYPQRLNGIQYRGIRDAPQMIRFLRAVLRPLERVTSNRDIVELMSIYDAVVVGRFDFNTPGESQLYNTFYVASLRAMEQDPAHEVAFAVGTNITMPKDIVGFHSPKVILQLWNSSIPYPEEEPFTPESLLKWIFSHIHQPAFWVSPPGVKSMSLSTFVGDGPVLFLFTPRNPFLDSTPNFDVLKEVGMEYYNCVDTGYVKWILEHLPSNHRRNKNRYKSAEKNCIPWIKQKLQVVSHAGSAKPLINDSCCQTVVVNEHVTKTKQDKICDVCMQTWNHDSFSFFGESISCSMIDSGSLEGLSVMFSGGCQETFPNHYNPFSYLSICCQSNDTSGDRREEELLRREEEVIKKSISSEIDDLTAHFEEEKCKRIYHGKLLHGVVFPKEVHLNTIPNITALACRTNKTLALLAMDSLKYHKFAERLGIDIMTRKDKTAVVIFDAEHETHYVMEKQFGKASLVEFIVDFTSGKLRRSLRFKTTSTKTCDESSLVCIEELNTETFEQVALNDSKDVVLLYRAPYCGFCGGISHTYLTVAKYFSRVKNLIFAHIDGENNDLSWEYMMEKYPTVVFFPAYRKSESRVFPQNLPITVTNLLNFVLANIQLETRLQAALTLCDKECIKQVRHDCLENIYEALQQHQVTSHRLRSVRMSLNRTISELATSSDNVVLQDKLKILWNHHGLLMKELNHLMRRLQNLKEIHLAFSTTNIIDLNSEQFRNIFESFRKYTRHSALAKSDTVNDLPRGFSDSEQSSSSYWVNIKDEL